MAPRLHCSYYANSRWLGGTPSFTLVLHTWKQDLGLHIHIHVLAAGGALAADGKWVSAKRGFLFPVTAVSGVFRGKFLDMLDTVRKADGLRHEVAKCEASWQKLIAALLRHDWVVYAKQPLGGVCACLGRVRPCGMNGFYIRWFERVFCVKWGTQVRLKRFISLRLVAT